MEKLKVKATSMSPPIDKGLDVRDTTFVGSGGAIIPLRIYSPTGRSEPGPALL